MKRFQKRLTLRRRAFNRMMGLAHERTCVGIAALSCDLIDEYAYRKFWRFDRAYSRCRNIWHGLPAFTHYPTL